MRIIILGLLLAGVVALACGDNGESSDDRGAIEPDAADVASSTSTRFGDGTHIVGADIDPGTYRNDGADRCYWERLSGFGGAVGDIIANGGDSAPFDDTAPVAIVTIAASDAGFYASRCGTWTRIGD